MIKKSTLLSEALKLGEVCSRKNNCCKYGSGALVGDDLKNIAGFLGVTEQELKKKYLEGVERLNTKRLRPKIIRKKNLPYGQCIFFKDGCTINEVKPLECKVGNCSKHGQELSIWFMLNYFLNAADPESVRQYAVYLKTSPTIAGGKLEEIIPDKEKLRKILDFEI